MEIFIIVGVSWISGMGIYIFCNKAKKYNNLIFYDISDKVIKYKKIKEKTNIHKIL